MAKRNMNISTSWKLIHNLNSFLKLQKSIKDRKKLIPYLLN
ncbi:hypothetical protein EU95_0486 [Prochlorococcus marinus str. MIT 9201]|uniref:Uncharacterized protein n=1 Tax=Prochlorococcus marinus str. MIT 9201 TaxID=93057 RepID=A0A0A2A722_PROMR|nr:hypothetical protein EU95_0486 [Prochlorococcus marinus str. MIT 9201]